MESSTIVCPTTRNFVNILNDNKHHFDELRRRAAKDSPRDNYICETGSDVRLQELLCKQQNLYALARESDQICQIGFGAGYTTLICLLANPRARILCVEETVLDCSESCYFYLRENFPNNEIWMLLGSALEIVTTSDRIFDLFHVDIGGNTQDIFSACCAKAHTRSHILWSFDEGKFVENEDVVMERGFLETSLHPQFICRVNRQVSHRIAVCSLTIGETYKEATRYATRSKEIYCAKHGYPFFDEEDLVDHSRAFSWSKIPLILRHLPDFDYIVWIDGDAQIMDPSIRLEDRIDYLSEGRDITIARDHVCPNMGVILIKNTEWSRKFLNLIYDQEHMIDAANWEQCAMIFLHKHNVSAATEHITILPLHKQNELNSYWYTYEYKTCFILHFPGCSRDLGNFDNLARALNTYCPIKQDNESEESYQKRVYWLIHESNQHALNMRK
jgi:hypothetical protein